MNLHVKKGDTVMIISGDDRGNKGKVLEVSPKEKKVIIEGRNMVKKHVKPRQMGQPGGMEGQPVSHSACTVCSTGMHNSACRTNGRGGKRTGRPFNAVIPAGTQGPTVILRVPLFS